jgi:hypothetical protein
MKLAWQAYGLGHLAKSIHGYYLVYRNFDNEMKTNRWFAKYETGSLDLRVWRTGEPD